MPLNPNHLPIHPVVKVGCKSPYNSGELASILSVLLSSFIVKQSFVSVESVLHNHLREILYVQRHHWLYNRVSTNLPEQISRRFPAGISRKMQDMFALLRSAMQCTESISLPKYITKTWHAQHRTVAKITKKAVLSQRWPRDPRYISRSWAVAEIWPFEFIQDGGGRHLLFVRTGNSAMPLDLPSPKTPL